MSSHAIGIGLIGTGILTAAAGGLVMFTTAKKKPATAKQPPLKPAIKKPAAAAAAEPAAEKPSAGGGSVKGFPLKFTVFDTKTRYLNEKSGVYISLHRLYTFLQFEDERVMFREMVKHIDNLMGLELLLKSTKSEKVAMVPIAAHSAKDLIQNLLSAIVQYSETNRPSKLKLRDMTDIAEEVMTAMKAIVYNLDMDLSSQPLSKIV